VTVNRMTVKRVLSQKRYKIIHTGKKDKSV